MSPQGLSDTPSLVITRISCYVPILFCSSNWNSRVHDLSGGFNCVRHCLRVCLELHATDCEAQKVPVSTCIKLFNRNLGTCLLAMDTPREGHACVSTGNEHKRIPRRCSAQAKAYYRTHNIRKFLLSFFWELDVKSHGAVAAGERS